MVDVAVVGAGQTKFGNHSLGLKGMWAEAALNAFQSVDGDFSPSQIDEAFIGSIAFGGSQLGNTAALLTEHSAMDGVPVRRVENACASSGFAFRDAWMAIKSGQADVVVAGGIEKMNDLTPERKRFWLGVSGDTEWERLAGLTFPGTYALMARRHFHEFDSNHDDLVHISVKNHCAWGHEPPRSHPKAGFVREGCRRLYGGRSVDAVRLLPYLRRGFLRNLGGRPCGSSSSPTRRFGFAALVLLRTGSLLHDRPSITQLKATAEASKTSISAERNYAQRHRPC